MSSPIETRELFDRADAAIAYARTLVAENRQLMAASRWVRRLNHIKMSQFADLSNRGMSLADLLKVLSHAAVEQAEGRARAAFYLANSEQTALHHVAGMTEDYARYVDGFAIG